VADIRSVYAGLRPLVKSSSRKTAELARDHLILVADSGLVTVTGGKWTTYRRMAEDTVDTAIEKAGLPVKECITARLPIHGAPGGYPGDSEGNEGLEEGPLHYHGTDAEAIRAIVRAHPLLGERLHHRLPYIRAEIVWAAREEMCMTLEDALSRRTRSLLLDAQAAIDAAPMVAALLAEELGKDASWQDAQVEEFRAVAEGYLAESYLMKP